MSKLTGPALAELYSSMSARGFTQAEIVSAAGYATPSGRPNFTLFCEELRASGHQQNTSLVPSGTHKYEILVPVITQAIIEVSSDDELTPDQILERAQDGQYDLVDLSSEIEPHLEGAVTLMDGGDGLYIVE